MGLLVAAMLAADMSTDSSYMLTWGSVIYNDLLAPFHKRRWSEKTGLLWNRCIVAAIGVFLLFFGLWYQLEGNVWDYLAVTGTIYLSSMSTLLIACCYWKRANNWGAYRRDCLRRRFPARVSAAQIIDKDLPDTANRSKIIGPFYSGIAAYAAAAIAMVVGSLLKDAVKPGPSSPVINEEASS